MKKSHGTILALAAVPVLMVVCLLSVGAANAGTEDLAPVPQTGQTTSYAPGDDGESQQGEEWPVPRFIDNLDGTVTDLLTGLVWLQDATRFSARGWNPALNACNNLADDGADLTDNSVAGDWRLPNNRELRRLIDFGNANPALPPGHPFTLPANGVYWTSTTALNNTGRAWYIDDGTMVNDPKNASHLVWPVRNSFDGDLGPAPVPKTGQTISYGTRDDGELQMGLEWTDPRFTDNLDGTVTDNMTGLIWFADATHFVDLPFSDALTVCNDLADDGVALTDGSVPGDWRLPNVLELGSLADYGRRGPALPAGNPFTIGNASTYWTSTSVAANTNKAWTLGTGIGKVSGMPKGIPAQAWPVRSGKPVGVDIVPYYARNPVKPRSMQIIPVALLGSASLDVTNVDVTTLRFGPDGASPAYPLPQTLVFTKHLWDVNKDGILDLISDYQVQDAGIACGDRSATLTFRLLDNRPFAGSDSITTLGCGVDRDLPPPQRLVDRRRAQPAEFSPHE